LPDPGNPTSNTIRGLAVFSANRPLYLIGTAHGWPQPDALERPVEV
jgi:hypothetical protein